MKLKASELRAMEKGQANINAVKKNEIYIILDNVLDTYNVGAVFRLADAVAAKKIILGGYTESPPNPRIRKSSINTTDWINWQHYKKTTDAIKELKKETPGIKIIAIEQNNKSIEYLKADYSMPIALIIGNETHGVSQEVMDMCDQLVELPMHGVNVSLNTMVSLGIVLYKTIEYNK